MGFQFPFNADVSPIASITWLLSLLLSYYLIEFLLRARSVDNREPPYIHPRVPVIGHVIGLIWHGGDYFSKISAKCQAPIYTLPIPKQKMYMIDSLSLVLSTGKVSKKLSFLPFVKIAAKQFSGIDDEAVLKKFDGDDEVNGISTDTIHAVESALLGRDEATELDQLVLEYTKVMLDELPSLISKPVALHQLLQHIMTQIGARTVYGPLNPLQTAEMEKAFWDFEHDMGIMAVEFAPDLLKRRAFQLREKIVNKFLAYYKMNGQDKGSALARARFTIPKNYGLSLLEIAKLEIPFTFAVLSNTSAAVFWIMVSILNRTNDLDRLRKELKSVISMESSRGQKTFTISLEDLKTKCPTLLSIFHEVMRIYVLRPNVRQVVEDTLLNDRFFLEKGSLVQLNVKSIHNDSKIWGDDASEMNLRRFLDRPNGGNLSKHTAAYGVFGFAPFICPGRHFAASQIMAVVAQLVMRYDIMPLDGVKWEVPDQNFKDFNNVPSPCKDIKVSFKEIPEWIGEWKYVLGKDGVKFPLASG